MDTWDRRTNEIPIQDGGCDSWRTERGATSTKVGHNSSFDEPVGGACWFLAAKRPESRAPRSVRSPRDGFVPAISPNPNRPHRLAPIAEFEPLWGVPQRERSREGVSSAISCLVQEGSSAASVDDGQAADRCRRGRQGGDGGAPRRGPLDVHEVSARTHVDRRARARRGGSVRCHRIRRRTSHARAVMIDAHTDMHGVRRAFLAGLP